MVSAVGVTGIELAYRVVDVFTDRPLAGNALCVVLEPAPEPVMAAIAREVNLSETTFVTRAGRGAYDLCIWTPTAELPFAGHPSLGTAWALGPGRWTQRSPGATVEVEASPEGAVMTQPEPSFEEGDLAPLAAALGLPGGHASAAHLAEIGGVRHLLVAVDAAVGRLRPDPVRLAELARGVKATGVAVLRALDDDNLQARVFVPGSTVFEDPGTGSAAGALAVLARRLWGTAEDVVVHQGAETGRPCRIEVHAGRDGVRVGGRVVGCAEGRFTL